MKKGKIIFDNVFNNKKVLITGDTGFKGSWLSIWLKTLGAKVYGYSLPPRTPMDNFVKTKLDNQISHYDGDIRNFPKVLKFFQEIKPEFAFHLAAQPLVIDSYLRPHYTFETNLMGVVNFFESVRLTPSVRVAINVTSDKCYLNDERISGYVETDPLGGKDPYSASKGCSELITISYIHSFFKDINAASVASVRAGNVIGGGDWAVNRIVPDFYRAIKKKEILKIRNPGAIRPWQHVLEPLGGYLLLASKLYTEGKKYQGGWNFGPNKSTIFTVLELVNMLSHFSNYNNYKIIKSSDSYQEANLLTLNISKAIKFLNWHPVMNFEKTVELTHIGYQADLKDMNIYQSRLKELEMYLEFMESENIK